MEALTTTLGPSRRLMTMLSAPPLCQRRQRYGGGRLGVVRASGGQRDHRWGRLVDENMVILRLRIREMKMMEEEEEGGGGDCGMMMPWEREYYEGEYGEHVFEGVRLLQSYLMNARPCFAVGMLLLVALSVFISSGFFLFSSINTMKALVSFSSSVFSLT